MGPLQQASIFLVETVSSFYILLLMLRFILQVVHADFYNPLSIFVVKLTNAPLIPLRRLIPGFGGIDLALVLLLFSFAVSKVILTFWIAHQRIPNINGAIVWSIGDLITLTIQIFFFAIFIRIIMSWISTTSSNPFMNILDYLTRPILQPAKRYIPAIGGVDISPLPIMVILQLLIILIGSPITQIGIHLA